MNALSAWRKHDNFRAMSNQCWFVFLTLKASCIRNLFHQDRLCKENSIATFWGDWGKTSSANIQTSGETTTGPCIITTLAHTSLIVRQFLASKNVTVITHPPYSDLTPWLFPFPKMKLKLQGQRFNSTEEIQTKKQDVIKTLTWNDLQQGFHHGNPAGIAVSMQKGTTS